MIFILSKECEQNKKRTNVTKCNKKRKQTVEKHIYVGEGNFHVVAAFLCHTYFSLTFLRDVLMS